ncbi:hypothetical protein [Pseudokineococcus lusitanus]|uniref:CopC domain-containing protein n=1 Tax=Pseudokineococcus lusitanus TaxID=763993 RepID=A0A3N1GA60_9ACTN|nr:hypothetical protein [Pseudokineococcus lusitanus]ROP27122.1 hypothetical protein EDC03_2645 [Pseudokineococcus lusitanus]
MTASAPTRRPARALVVLLGVLAVLLGGAMPASAHGGPIDVDVADDGTGALTLVATWREDGHMVGPEVDFTGTATGPDGRVVEGIDFALQAEGEGFRVSTTQLAAGDWEVALQAAGGSDQSWDVPVTSGGPPEPTASPTPAAAATATPSPGAPTVTDETTLRATRTAEPAEPAAATTDGTSAGPGAGVVALVGGIVVIGVVALLLVRARRRRTP